MDTLFNGLKSRTAFMDTPKMIIQEKLTYYNYYNNYYY